MPFEVVKRDSRPGLVVRVERRQLADGRRLPPELLDQPCAGGERRPLALVGERHGYPGAGDPGQRLDGILLDRGQVVEPGEEHRRCLPAVRLRPQRIERPPGKALGIGPPQTDPIESLEVGAI